MILAPTAEALAQAATLLRAGEVVAHPTETVYGLAVDPFSETAVRRLFAVKGRPETNPVLMIIDAPAQLSSVVGKVSPEVERLITAFWPGPLSILMPRHEAVPEILTAGSGKICVRCPGCETARALCLAFGGAVTSTSANLAGEAPARSAADALLPGVALVLDGGTLAQQVPSTIYDPETDRVLRVGPVSLAEIHAALGR